LKLVRQRGFWVARLFGTSFPTTQILNFQKFAWGLRSSHPYL
jgi:hypothetical protein